jgi:plasmid replication initiation protein
MAEKKPSRDLQPFDDSDLVVLRNPVAKARFNLSVYQTKFLLEVLSHLKSKPEARIIEFNIRQFNKSLNLNNNDIKYYVNEIRKMVRHVVSIPVEERNDGGIRLKEVALIAAIDTDINGKGEGSIKIEVADMIKPYFLEIANGQFFSFHKYNSRVLKGRHSISLYLLLKSYQRFKTFQIDYEELRDILEIKTEEYRPFKEFKRWVLERSRKEMLEKNDIYFDYEAIRVSLSKKSDVAKILFHIKSNPNHAEVFRQFQIKEGKIKEPTVQISASTINKTGEISEGRKAQTGENSELLSNDILETFQRVFPVAESLSVPESSEIMNLLRFFDQETPQNALRVYLTGLQTHGFSDERILDVLLYAQERQQKGEKIRNIMGYVRHGLDTETMGLGLAKKKTTEGRGDADNTRFERQQKDSKFTAWLQQYYIKSGIEADNDVKIAFVEASRKIKALANYFDEEGKIKETHKDKLRVSLGKKIADTEGVTLDMLFVQWMFDTQQIKLKRMNGKWQQIVD